MDMTVTSRVCRYDGHEYNRGEIIRDVAPNHARVLKTLGKASEIPPEPVGRVATTQALPLGEPAAASPVLPASEKVSAASQRPAADPADAAEDAPSPPSAELPLGGSDGARAPRRKRGAYQTRDLTAED